MGPDELAQHITEATGVVERHEVAHGELSVWVAPENWLSTARHLHDCGHCRFDFITFLSAVDEEERGFEVVLHVYSVRRQHHVNLKALVPRENPTIASLSDVWLGANWCERETWELFGIEFEGHPNLVKLLLPVEFDGFPLRKDFLLMTREAKEWPGMKEPAEA
ncbi:MAG TPA: NADH-quinone oxidoreductase subunit C [Actinomycetota bacterium]|nr:NADH-quinone oxidoreductase subunit C [Actinomycetota bacterium]